MKIVIPPLPPFRKRGMGDLKAIFYVISIINGPNHFWILEFGYYLMIGVWNLVIIWSFKTFVKG
jgi:hypothetical protein